MWNAAWYTANEMFGTPEDAQRDQAKFEAYASQFKSQGIISGVVSANASDIIKNMFSSAAWAVAKERKGSQLVGEERQQYKEDGAREKENMEKEYSNLIATGEVRNCSYLL